MNARLPLRRRVLASALAAGSALLAGCSPFRVVNALVPTRTYRRTEGIAYGTHPRHRLDVYRPREAASGAPLVVFFYGGNWTAGERGNYVFAGEALASRGFVAVIPDYRLYPEVRFPDFLHDSARAFAWAVAHAAEIGSDPERIFLMGHSAGAYNAAMLAFAPEYLRAASVEQRRIRGFVGLAGPYDFLPLQSDTTKGVFGYPDTPPVTQPINHASAHDPRALLITGTDDNVVDPGNTTRLAERLRRNGVEVKTVIYPGIGHTTLAGALAAPFRGFAPVLDEIEGFIRG